MHKSISVEGDRNMFNLERYEDLIKRLVDSGLKPTTDWNEKLDSNSLLLRHDVDFSIEFAYRLAVAENKLNIYSTFFFMFTSNLYNPLSEHNQNLLRILLIWVIKFQYILFLQHIKA